MKPLCLLLALCVHPLLSAGISVDPDLPAYKKISGVSGNLSSVGSDTLANLMTLWAEEFKRLYPGVVIQVQAAGSSTAPPALIEATTNLGPMSRLMRATEVQAFEERFGYRATAVPVAIDALAIYVHKDNPIEQFSITQLDAIYSATRRCGAKREILAWGQVGLEGPWHRRSIQVFGRNSVSGTYGYFKKKALCRGDFKNTVNEQPGSAAVVQAVATSLSAVGYSGIGYRSAGVRAVPLLDPSGKAVEASLDNVLLGRYPLARYLYIYVNKMPGRELPPLEREFLRMVLSDIGQRVVLKDGYIPLPAGVAGPRAQALSR